MNQAAHNLAKLRHHMQINQLDAWIAPSADPHLSEYLPEHWQTRQYLSGFTGSVGTLVVTANQAGVWVDSRYWEQASKQLTHSGIELQKEGEVEPYHQWLVQHLPPNAVVGVAADSLSITTAEKLQSAFKQKNIQLDVTHDLINYVWENRPALPHAEIYPHPQEFVSTTTADKLSQVREVMQQHHAQHHLISSLDDIAWLTNLRGGDVPYNPVFLAYLLISLNDATLYVDDSKLNEAARDNLKIAHINIKDYHQIGNDLASLSGSLLLQPEKTAISTIQHLSKHVDCIHAINPSTFLKSVKSPEDIAHVREAMRQDGAALCNFFAEFEQKLAAGEQLTELDVDTMLYHHRSQRPHFVSLSFGTIAGYNANGALPHYSATPTSYSEITGNGLLLIDSGAQYLGGTTDITRVIPIGTPNEAQKQDYTLVLKAHIALARAVFPNHIPSPALDAICRLPLWQTQRNYGHGTGHGVGYFMNVHEGPQVISYLRDTHPSQAMKVGMITSNEPGLYRVGKWGIRIENLVVNQKVPSPQEHEFGEYLYFETLTLCPINTQLIERTLLNLEEIQWLNDYHQTVRKQLLPLVDGIAREWLLKHTQAIE